VLLKSSDGAMERVTNSELKRWLVLSAEKSRQP
jgi:hypothetical protein